MQSGGAGFVFAGTPTVSALPFVFIKHTGIQHVGNIKPGTNSIKRNTNSEVTRGEQEHPITAASFLRKIN